MRSLVVAFAAAELADALTWLALPAGAERNPVAAAAAVEAGFGLKAALVLLVVAVVAVCLTARRRGLAELVLVVGIFAGGLGTGSNIAAAGASRSVQEPAPLSGSSGQRVTAPRLAPGRSEAPWPHSLPPGLGVRADGAPSTVPPAVGSGDAPGPWQAFRAERVAVPCA